MTAAALTVTEEILTIATGTIRGDRRSCGTSAMMTRENSAAVLVTRASRPAGNLGEIRAMMRHRCPPNRHRRLRSARHSVIGARPPGGMPRGRATARHLLDIGLEGKGEQRELRRVLEGQRDAEASIPVTNGLNQIIVFYL
jgi:hypothetical protein